MDSQSSAPKFASFKRKAAPVDNETHAPPKNSASDHSDVKRRGGRHSGDKHHKRRRHSSRSQERRVRRQDHDSEKHSLSIRSEAHVTLTSDWDDSTRPYFADRRGDHNNLTYGSLHRYHVPPYARAGCRCVIGLPSECRIESSSSSDGGIILGDGRRNTRPERKLLSKRYAKQLEQHERIIRSAAAKNPESESEQYISLASSRRHHRSYDRSKVWESDSSSSHSSDSTSEQEQQDKPYSDDAKAKNIQLSRATKENPKLIDHWLNLIEHQGKMVQLDHHGGSTKLNNAERRNAAEIRISIYEQALRNIGADRDSRVRLTTGLLDQGANIWESKKLAERWNAALRELPDNADLWVKYLDFIQANFREFRLDTVRERYTGCLQMLSEMAVSAPQTGMSASKLQRILLYVYARFTRLLSEAGFHEQSLALWQSVLEYSYFKPDIIRNLEQSDALNRFEEFWDSEVPRIGERGALGWGNFSEDQPSLESRGSALRSDVGTRAPYETFYRLETKHMQTLNHPGRTADETSENDPYHVILYSDVSTYIPLLGIGLNIFDVLEAFLAFWDLPPLCANGERALDSTDVFLRKGALHQSMVSSTHPEEPLSHFAGSMSAMERFPMRRISMNQTDLFQNAFDAFSEGRNTDFIGRVLESLASTTREESILEYWIAFATKFSAGDARKVARSALEKCPSSLRLYNAYALVESCLGDTVASDRVFSTALRMSAKLPERAQKDVILLYQCWAWERLRRGDLESTFSNLLSARDSSSVSPDAVTFADTDASAFFQARNVLLAGREKHFTAEDHNRALSYTDCLSLLLYLQSSQDLSPALDNYKDTHDRLTTAHLQSSPQNELNHQFQARLLSFHASQSRFFKPALLRSTLHSSLQLFPNNTLLLSVFAANEARFRIDDRVRSLLDSTALRHSNSTIVSWTFAIFTEMRRGSHGGSTAHSVRATFERAVALPHIQHNPSLWMSYVRFEADEASKTGEKEAKERAKRVFFRGMIMLPWCKEFMMLAFSPLLVNSMTQIELRRVWNVLGEKELRVFVDMDDVFGRMDLDGGGALMALPEDAESGED